MTGRKPRQPPKELTGSASLKKPQLFRPIPFQAMQPAFFYLPCCTNNLRLKYHLLSCAGKHVSMNHYCCGYPERYYAPYPNHLLHQTTGL